MSYSTGIEFARNNKAYTLSDALSKVYLIKSKTNGSGGLAAYVYFPKCLMGKRVRLVLVKEKKE
jgi:hypothetical protein